jgi:SPFH domain / Band 7 family
MVKSLRNIIILIVAVLLLFGVFRYGFKKVPIDRVGVRLSRFSGQGYDQKDYPPGYVWAPGVFFELELMDPTWQFLQMGGGASRPLELRSSDQYTTTADLTVVYRVRQGNSHQVRRDIGPGVLFHRIFQTAAETALWSVLAELKTEEFFNAEKRVEQSLATLNWLNNVAKIDEKTVEKAPIEGDKLKKASLMEANALLIRNILYDPRFEKQLLAKQLLDQNRLLNQTQEILEKEKQITEAIGKETDAKVLAVSEEMSKEIRKLVSSTDAQLAGINADAELWAQTLVAEANREKREKIALGELAKTQAQAIGDKAINEAYASKGGRLLLGRKIITNMQLGDIEINTNITNPFDVRQMLNMLDVEAEK